MKTWDFMSKLKYSSSSKIPRSKKSRKVLSSKRNNLVNTPTKDNKPQATNALTDEDEDKLSQSGALGDRADFV